LVTFSIYFVTYPKKGRNIFKAKRKKTLYLCLYFSKSHIPSTAPVDYAVRHGCFQETLYIDQENWDHIHDKGKYVTGICFFYPPRPMEKNTKQIATNCFQNKGKIKA
jgi:hypothetical protein